jgi:RNA polymerase sigma factor (TIGR02999 family)
MDAPADLTLLLLDAQAGKPEALGRLLPAVYEELRALAHQRRRFERPDHTLNTTALVHEAYLRLVDQRRADWQNRAHFFAVAATAMRRVLLEYARARRAQKRGGGETPLSADGLADVLSDDEAEEVIALDEALGRLAAFNERGCRVVEYRYFVGLSYEEIAEVMGLSVMTVRRAWEAARAWLHADLHPDAP